MTRACMKKVTLTMRHKDGTVTTHVHRAPILDLRILHTACRKHFGHSLGVAVVNDTMRWRFADGDVFLTGDIREAHGFRSLR